MSYYHGTWAGLQKSENPNTPVRCVENRFAFEWQFFSASSAAAACIVVQLLSLTASITAKEKINDFLCLPFTIVLLLYKWVYFSRFTKASIWINGKPASVFVHNYYRSKY